MLGALVMTYMGAPRQHFWVGQIYGELRHNIVGTNRNHWVMRVNFNKE